MKMTTADFKPGRFPQVGETAPALALPMIDGPIFALDEQANPVALVFMRHLA